MMTKLYHKKKICINEFICSYALVNVFLIFDSTFCHYRLYNTQYLGGKYIRRL